MPPKLDVNRAGWEETEFPSVCESCLGPNPYVRMTKESYGNECKLCTRPFTDLQFGLPLPIRDAALKMIKQGPNTNINREYFAQTQASKYENDSTPFESGKAESAARGLLKQLARSEPYQRKQRAQIDDSEARELIQSANELTESDQPPIFNLSNSGKIKVNMNPDLTPPRDKSICSLFLLGVEDDLAQYSIKAHFEPYGAVKSVVCSHRAKCAFVNFGNRESAERAASACANAETVIKGCPLKVQWGKPRPLGGSQNEGVHAKMATLATQNHSALRKDKQKRIVDSDPQQSIENEQSDTPRSTLHVSLPAGSGSVQYPSQLRQSDQEET